MKKMSEPNPQKKLLLGVSIAIVVAVVAWSLYITGSPERNRQLQTDMWRMQDVHKLNQAVNIYFEHVGELPVALDELESFILSMRHQEYLIRLQLKDEEYSYRPTGEKTFEICTTFIHDSMMREKQYLNHFEHSWKKNSVYKHPGGEHCFALLVKEKKE